MPIVGVSETEPPGMNYRPGWAQLDALPRPLPGWFVRPAEESKDAVELDNVTIALAGRPILQGISLAIESGEFIGVLGPNGSGKTTLMRAILGLIPLRRQHPRAGRAGARGNPAVGYMPQHRQRPAAFA